MILAAAACNKQRAGVENVVVNGTQVIKAKRGLWKRAVNVRYFGVSATTPAAKTGLAKLMRLARLFECESNFSKRSVAREVGVRKPKTEWLVAKGKKKGRQLTR